MDSTIAYLRNKLKSLSTQIGTPAQAGSGGNPTGGTVDLATTNYQAALLQQWISLELGSSSAVSMNLLSSLLEPFNLYASTALYLGQSSVNNAVNDVTFALVAGTSTYLPGFRNPEHLRMSLHFNGTGTSIPNDLPIYQTVNGSWNQSGTVTPSAVVHFTNAGGTPAASSTDGSQLAANAFDGSTVTYWSSYADGILPIASGVASASTGTAANAFDGNIATEWISVLNTLYPNVGIGVSIGDAGVSGYELYRAFDNNTSTKWLVLSPNGNVGWDLGSGNSTVVKTYGIYGEGTGDSFNAKSWNFQGSNDNSNWTTIDSKSNQTSWNGWKYFACTSNTTAYRYHRMNITATNYSGGNRLAQTEQAGYDLFSNVPQWLKFDNGVGHSIIPLHYSINSTTFTPNSWLFQGSNDNSNWDTLETVTNYTSAFPRTGTISTATAYRYYRLYITATNDTNNLQVSISEFSVNRTDVIFTSQQLNYDCGSLRLAQNYTVNSSTSDKPLSWTFEGSNDNNNWTVLDTVTNNIAAFPLTRTMISNWTSYRYYRLNVSASTGPVVKITELSASLTGGAASCDTSNFVFGTAALLLTGNTYLTFTALSANWANLSNNDWNFNCRVRPMTQPNVMSILTLGKSATKYIEIQMISTGLQLKYSMDGSTFTTITSSAVTWTPNTFYHISVGRSGNTLYFFVNGASAGTASFNVTLPNVTLMTPSGYIGCDSVQDVKTMFIGNIDELEFFVGENPYATEFTPPVAERSTAYIQAVNWCSQANYVPSGITSVGMLLFFDEVTYASFGFPTVGTDLVVAISLDNGATYHTITLTKNGSLTSNTRIYKGTLNVTGLTNTNQLKYRITSASGKVVKYDGAVIYWA